MFGVVLWSDVQEHKAVIWCEDHGDLAFYRQECGDAAMHLDAGDLVQFDMTTDRHQRLAHNPRLVAEGVCPDIADVLSSAGPQSQKPAASQRPASRGTADIIPFSNAGTARKTAPPARVLHTA